jgi:subtilisin-like proprotein convertase family protein
MSSTFKVRRVAATALPAVIALSAAMAPTPASAATPTCTTITDHGVTMIPDLDSVSIPVTVSGCASNGASTVTLEVHITHTYRGDLAIDLYAPDGAAVFRLKDPDPDDSADNVDATYTVNSPVTIGVWLLRVSDVAEFDTGQINSWTLTI